MNDLLNNSLKKSPLLLSDFFRELGNDSFFINSDCINTKNHILVKDRVYQIVDILKNAETHITHIKFKEAYLKGYEFYVVGVKIETGELVYCHHRLNNGMLNCDWVIIDLDLFEKEVYEDTIKFSFKRKQLLNDTL